MADIIRVSAKSRAPSVAGAIAGVVREAGRADVQAIGAGAVNQAVKAAAIARGCRTNVPAKKVTPEGGKLSSP